MYNQQLLWSIIIFWWIDNIGGGGKGQTFIGLVIYLLAGIIKEAESASWSLIFKVSQGLQKWSTFGQDHSEQVTTNTFYISFLYLNISKLWRFLAHLCLEAGVKWLRLNKLKLNQPKTERSDAMNLFNRWKVNCFGRLFILYDAFILCVILILLINCYIAFNVFATCYCFVNELESKEIR